MAFVACSVCLNEFRDPRVLSCGHTFCLQCIEDLTRDHRTLKCPQCRQMHAGFTTAAAIPRNITANDLIEAMQRMRLSAANASGRAAATSSTLHDDGDKNLISCTECGLNCTIDELLFCKMHNYCACPKCCQLMHKQCEAVNAVEHACNVLLENNISLESAQSVLDKSSKRLAQDISCSSVRLKQWADAFNKAHVLHERTGQLIQNRLCDLSKEVSNHRGLLADLLTSKVNAAARLYSGDWANGDRLVAKCARYAEVDLVKLAGFAEDNIAQHLGKEDKLMFPVLDEELTNINVDMLLRQIEDKLVQMEMMKQSFYVLDTRDTNGFKKFHKLNESRSVWKELSPPLQPRRRNFSLAACVGKLYIVGGEQKAEDKWLTTNLVQQYDAQTGWRDCTPMLEHRERCGASALGGRLLAVGGYAADRKILNSVEECDLETGRWTHVAPMTAARCGVGVAPLGNLLFVVGGYNGKSSLASTEWYDSRAGRFTKAALLHEPRWGCSCAALGDRLYVAGGFTGLKQWTASVECLDLRAGRWTRVRDMSASRAYFALAPLNGHLLVAGGVTNGRKELDTLEMFDVKRDAWITLDVRLPRSASGACTGCLLEE